MEKKIEETNAARIFLLDSRGPKKSSYTRVLNHPIG